MGILDDAIREHLELKRRRGADPTEMERLEREALGPVRRSPEAPTDMPLQTADDEEAAVYEEPELADWGEPSLDEDELAVEPEPALDEPPQGGPASSDGLFDHEADTEAPIPESAPAEPSMVEPPPAGELEPSAAAVAPPPTPAAPVREPAEPEPVTEPEPPEHLSEETAEYDVEAEHAREPGAADRPPAGGKTGEDVLEETPEFLQDTPDHDRLWFEQRPPRDFEFDE